VGRRALEPVHSSPADIVAISGTAVGGITVSARAGYGPTITVSTCGPATNVFATPTSRELAAPNKSRRASRRLTAFADENNAAGNLPPSPQPQASSRS
jgi:hypothetical protein